MTNIDKLLLLKIDAYIKGKLPEPERQAFDQQLASDPKLAEQVETQRAELAVLDLVFEEELRQKAQKWSAEADLKANRTPLSMWAMAAAFLAAIVASLWMFQKNKNSDKKDAQIIEKKDTLQSKRSFPTDSIPATRGFEPKIAQNPQPNPAVKPNTIPPNKKQSPIPPTTVTNPTNEATITLNFEYQKDLLAYVKDIERNTQRGVTATEDPLSKMLQLIENQDFTKARAVFKTVPIDATYYIDCQFYAATIDLLDNKPSQAAAEFQKLADNDNYFRHEQAAFYYAVSLLKNGQKEEGKRVLERIVEDAEHEKQKAAAELLRNL